jgi:uncharacterized membrane protein YhfC
MGWSFFEVILIYCVNIFYYLSINQQVTFFDSLPGLIERLSATILHLSLTIIALKALNNKKLLLLGILLHIVVNLFALIFYALNVNLWLIEIALFFIVVWVYYISNQIKSGEGNAKRRDSKKAKRK